MNDYFHHPVHLAFIVFFFQRLLPLVIHFFTACQTYFKFCKSFIGYKQFDGNNRIARFFCCPGAVCWALFWWAVVYGRAKGLVIVVCTEKISGEAGINPESAKLDESEPFLLREPRKPLITALIIYQWFKWDITSLVAWEWLNMDPCRASPPSRAILAAFAVLSPRQYGKQFQGR